MKVEVTIHSWRDDFARFLSCPFEEERKEETVAILRLSTWSQGFFLSFSSCRNSPWRGIPTGAALTTLTMKLLKGDLKAIRDKDHQGDVSSFFFFLLFSSLFFFPSQQQQHDYNLDFPVTKAL